MFARDVEMFIEHCENKGLATKTIGSYEQTLRLLMLWLDEQGIRDAAIYHFGTGGHHHVGIECALPERRNNVLAITAAPREHEAFVQLATARPHLLRYYNAVFGDIYLLNERLLPEFDVVTLFHLCEFRGAANDEYGALTDLEVTRALTRRLKPGGPRMPQP